MDEFLHFTLRFLCNAGILEVIDVLVRYNANLNASNNDELDIQRENCLVSVTYVKYNSIKHKQYVQEMLSTKIGQKMKK